MVVHATTSELSTLQSTPSNVRNICIVAHVDHGKTTLSDNLIASNGLIHPKMVGKLRYLDSREDEQERGVTMKSSSIALLHRSEGKSKSLDYLINLIDSPGHVDFCGEVSTAARLSDGALVVVDVCEGVHIQTHAVLRQIWDEKLRPCLVLNKMDRLVTELKLTPQETYNRLKGILVEVNNIIHTFRSEQYISDVDSVLGTNTAAEAALHESDDSEDEFSPLKRNVIFCSAIEGWAFKIEQFGPLCASKLNTTEDQIVPKLWGDFHFSPKTKSIEPGPPPSPKLKPTFVQFVLEPVFQVYNEIFEGAGASSPVLLRMISSLGLEIPPRELASPSPNSLLQSLLSRWLPLAPAVLQTVVDVLPSPVEAAPIRIQRWMPGQHQASQYPDNADLSRAISAVRSCDPSDAAPAVCFVAKMLAVPWDLMPRSARESAPPGTHGSECFLGFGRVFSGRVHRGQSMLLLSSGYDPGDPGTWDRHCQAVQLSGLYLMMGQSLEPLESVPAGSCVAIQGLDLAVSRSSTLSSQPQCVPFSDLGLQSAPIVRVALEPSLPADLPAFTRGLALLQRADPFLEVSCSDRGETVLSVAGEVHLERVVKDLQERFARVPLVVSPPLVSFRECIQEGTLGTWGPATEAVTSNGRFRVRVQVTRLPGSLAQSLEDNSGRLKKIFGSDGLRSADRVKKILEGEEGRRLRSAIHSSLNSSGDFWQSQRGKFWSLGPKHFGPNVLLQADEPVGDRQVATSAFKPRVSIVLGLDAGQETELAGVNEEIRDGSGDLATLEGSMVTGFQLATAAGPLCEEPLWGLGFRIQGDYIGDLGEGNDDNEASSDTVPFSVQVSSCVREVCRTAVLAGGPRLAEALFLCEVSTSADSLGQVYAVLSKRRAEILQEEMIEGSGLFKVHAHMPVSESFGFTDELRRKTSGAATPQLVLSHWAVLEVDPFFVPRTEEEKEEFGDGASLVHNVARKMVDSVRRRKGLAVQEKVVEKGTKQRTLAKKV